jgi:hypothetical protein
MPRVEWMGNKMGSIHGSAVMVDSFAFYLSRIAAP